MNYLLDNYVGKKNARERGLFTTLEGICVRSKSQGTVLVGLLSANPVLCLLQGMVLTRGCDWSSGLMDNVPPIYSSKNLLGREASSRPNREYAYRHAVMFVGLLSGYPRLAPAFQTDSREGAVSVTGMNIVISRSPLEQPDASRENISSGDRHVPYHDFSVTD